MNEPKLLDQKKEKHMVITLMAVAIGLRLLNLLDKGFWLDEIFTAIFASPGNGFREIYNLAINTPIPSPPLIFWITNIFMRLFGVSELVVRMPSIIAGGIGVAATYYLGKELLNREAGLIGAILLTISAQHIYYSREARYYAFLMLFSMVAMMYFNRAVKTNQRESWIWYGVFTLLNILTHLSGFFISAAQGLFIFGISIQGWLKRPQERNKIRDLLITFVIVIIAIGLFIFPLINPIKGSFTGERGFGNENSSVKDLLFSANFVFGLFADFGAGEKLPLWTFMGFAIIGIIFAFRDYRSTLLHFGLISVTPFVFIATVNPRHWFEVKYVIFLMPLYLLLVGLGVSYFTDLAINYSRKISSRIGNVYIILDEKINSKNFRAALFSCFVLLLFMMSLGNIGKGYNQRHDGISVMGNFLDRVYKSGDGVVVYPKIGLLTMSLDNMVGYYFLKSGVEDREIIIVQDVENLNEILAEYSRVWFIYQEVEKRENLIPIRDWVEKQEGIVYEIGFFRLFYTGNNVSQLELVNEAYQLDNSEFNFRVVGTYYFKLHMFEEAVQAFEKVIELQPELMANHLRLAYLYDQLGEFDKALATYQYVLQMNKKNPSYHAALGDFYFRNEKHDMALIEYSEAVKLWETASWKSNSKNDLALINTWKLIINGLENQ